MLTPEQVSKILALSRVLATRRVRRFAVQNGIGGRNETLEGTRAALERANKELGDYVTSLVNESQFEAQSNGAR